MAPSAQTILQDILRDGIDVHRCAAARAIGVIGGPGAGEALREALFDEDPDVRSDAAEALGAQGGSGSVGALMENLIGDPDTDVKKAALAALLRLGHEEVVPLLRKLAVSRTDDIVWDEDEFYSEGWDSWLDMQLLAIRGLGEFGTEAAVPDILTAMADEMGQDVSEAGVAALAAMGAPGARALGALYSAGNPRVRRRVAAAAVQADNPHTSDLIARFLTDDEARVREIAATGLSPGDDRLAPLFADPEPAVRAAVVRHAGAQHATEVTGLIADPESAVRAEVFKVIAAHPDLFGGEKLALSVQKAIAGEPEAARAAAVALVALRGADSIKGLTHAMTNTELPLEFRLGAVEALEKAGPVSVPHLLKAAGDDERRMRLAALTALVGFAADDPVWPNAAAEGLLAALNGELVVAPEEPEEAPEEPPQDDLPPEADTAAAEEEREVDDTLPLVPEAEASPTSTLKTILAGRAGPDGPEDQAEPEAVELSEQDLRLLQLAEQRRMSKRRMSLDTAVAPHLDVRRFAASLLGGVPNPEVTDNLIAILGGDDEELRGEALDSLVQHGETLGVLPAAALPALREQLASANADARALATRALAWVGDESAEAALREQLTTADPLVRVEAVRALGRRGVADAQIEACLNDDYVGVATEAAKALARVRGEDAVDALVGFALKHDGTYRDDIGRLLGAYTGEAGINRLVEILGDDAYLRHRLVAIDALARAYEQLNQPEELKVA